MSIDNGYNTAQICKNGHLITEYSSSYPQHNKKFCQKCGEITITNCESCKEPIQGAYHLHIASAAHREFPIPKYCHNCGKPYPWTELHIRAARKIIDQLDELPSSERDDLKNAINDIAKDTPDAKPAAYKIRTALTKLRGEAQTMLRDLIVEIASEAIVKIIMPNK